MKLKFGIELEVGFNRYLLPLRVDGYHQGSLGNNPDYFPKYWKVERDGSLSVSKSEMTKGLDVNPEFVEPATCELISKVLTKRTFNSAIKELKNACENEEFKYFFKINETMGCHIHFSDDTDSYSSFVKYDKFNELRNNTFARVKKELPHLYDSFVKNYFRGGQASEHEDEMIPSQRKKEFNFTSMKNGIEWRSFNLIGVDSWKDLEKLLRIGIEEIEKMLTKFREERCEESFDLKIPTSVLEDEDSIAY